MSREQREMDRHREGRAACRSGHGTDACPYDGQERDDWLAGWREQLRERMGGPSGHDEEAIHRLRASGMSRVEAIEALDRQRRGQP